MPKRVVAATRVALLVGVTCCAAAGGEQQLSMVLQDYNECLRWKRFDQAAKYMVGPDRDAFMLQASRLEHDLYVDTIRVESVVMKEGEAPGIVMSADARVVAQAYVLPSTVLQRLEQVQHWQMHNGFWTLVSWDKPLLPKPASTGSRPKKTQESSLDVTGEQVPGQTGSTADIDAEASGR